MSQRASLRFLSAVLLAAALGTAPACGAGHGRVYVRIAPPAPIVEVRGEAPRGYVWADGYHRWDGGVYTWTPGRWIAPPRPGAVWVPAHWVHDRHGWYFIDGHWR